MVVSDTSITVNSPPGLTAGPVDVTVVNSGGRSGTSSADVFTYTTTTDGPRVTSVVRYGYHSQPTYIVIYFDMALDRNSVQLASNYKLEAWHIVGLLGQSIPVKAAKYNAKTHAVTLSFSQRLVLRKTYTLTINGTTSSGIKNVAVVLLDGGNTGHPGSNFVTTITQQNLAGSANQRPAPTAVRTRVKILPAHASGAARHRDV